MKGIEHIGIAVKNLEKSEKLFELLLDKKPYKREVVESENVITSFFLINNIKIELLASINESSPIYKFIEKRGEGIHHIAFDTDNIEDNLINFNNLGIELINKSPKDGADNKKIAFLHPKSTNGVLMELCQNKNSDK